MQCDTLSNGAAATALTNTWNASWTMNLRSENSSEMAIELTVGETYFFRHSEQFEAFLEVALPQRIKARASRAFFAHSCRRGAHRAKRPTRWLPPWWISRLFKVGMSVSAALT